MTAEEAFIVMVSGGTSGSANINSLMATKNSTYIAGGNVAGYSPVAVLSPGNCGNLIGAYMCDLFEAQTPIIEGSIFGNYTFKVCAMPIRKYYLPFIWSIGFYLSGELLYITDPKKGGIYEVDPSTLDTSSAKITTTYSSSDDIPIYYYRYGYTVLSVPSFKVEVKGVTVNERKSSTSAWYTTTCYFYGKLKEAGQEDRDGLNGYDTLWHYTRFKGDELIAKIKQVGDDLRQYGGT